MDVLWGDPANYVLVRWLFLRLLGLVYLIACLSFGVQARGLIGTQGILPADSYLAAVRSSVGWRAYLKLPTLLWLGARDAVLSAVCAAGALSGALLLLGVQATWTLLVPWLCYLSLVNASEEFLGYQWDALLLEAGFLAIFLVPPSVLPGQALAPPSPVVILLFRWLIFRLMFMSGMMKLVSRDATWRNLTALTYHYETQPLPTPLAWYVCRAPLWFHKLSTLATLAIELPVPFLFLAPSPLRVAAGLLTVFLQIMILLTGNYAFFNLLTIFLAVFAADDMILGRIVPAARLGLSPAGGPAVAWGGIVPVVLAVPLVLVGILHILRPWLSGTALWRALLPGLRVAEVLRLVNPYGLFAVMTTLRPEIIVEGSDDGHNWLAYEFKFKPGDLRRTPPWVAPHQPRLDWQMWFASLSTYASNPWFLFFAQHLLEGTPEVLALLAHDPFPHQPPLYIRAALYNYHFTTPGERSGSGQWWRRELLGLYLPPVSKPNPAP